MSSDEFILLLESYHPEKRALSNQLKAFLGSALHELSYRKKYQLLNENQVPSYAWYLTKGTARVHYYDQYSQQEVTSWFWFKGELVISLNSFFRQHPSGENIQLLEDSTLLRISFADMQIMNRQYPEYRQAEKLLFEDYYSRFNEHSRNMYCQPTRVRYEQLEKTHKELLNIANQKDIASFLKMHPKSLSHLRSGK